MTKSNYILITSLFITLLIAKSNAQFTPSSISDVVIQTHVTASHTGNDVLDDVSGGDTYRVSVCDNPAGNAPGLIYDVDYNGNNYQTTDPFTERDAYDPDVCLVTGTNSVVYALAVYYSSNAGGCVFDVFEWTGSGFSLLSSNTFSTVYGNAVNIDSDNQGNFVIVLDDGSGRIYTCGGTAGTGPSIARPIQRVDAALFNTGLSDPDICIYQDGINTKVYICYLYNTTTLYVSVTNLATATGGSSYTAGPVTNSSAASGYVLENPRIACGISSGNSNNFTVVYIEADRVNSLYYVKGITRLSTSFISHIYNDASSYADLHTQPNINPVVAYDCRSSFNIWIGWSFDDNGTPINSPVAFYPIVLKCNSAGDQVGGTYWEVPDVLSSSYPTDYYDNLSLASRWSDPSSGNAKLLLTFYDNGGNAILEKEKDPAADGALRAGNSTMSNVDILTDLGENCTIELYNTNGLMIVRSFTSNELVNSEFRKIKNHIASGLYLYTVTSADGKTIRTGKLFKQ